MISENQINENLLHHHDTHQRQINKPKSREIKKFIKRPPFQICMKENILEQESVPTDSSQTSDSAKESCYSNTHFIANSTNESTSCMDDYLETRLAKLELSIPDKIRSLGKNISNNENLNLDNLTPANRRLALLKMKINKSRSPKKTFLQENSSNSSSMTQDLQQNVSFSKLPNSESSVPIKCTFKAKDNTDNNNFIRNSANKRLALLREKLNINKSPEKRLDLMTSHTVLNEMQHISCSKLVNDTFEKNTNNNFIPVIDKKSQANTQTWSLSKTLWPVDTQTNLEGYVPTLSCEESLILTNIHTGLICSSQIYTNPSKQNKLLNAKDWSLSDKIWFPNKIQPKNTQVLTPIQTTKSNAEFSNKQSSPIHIMENSLLEKVDDKVIDGTPNKSRLSITLEKYRKSPTVTPSKPVMNDSK